MRGLDYQEAPYHFEEAPADYRGAKHTAIEKREIITDFWLWNT